MLVFQPGVNQRPRTASGAYFIADARCRRRECEDVADWQLSYFRGLARRMAVLLIARNGAEQMPKIREVERHIVGINDFFTSSIVRSTPNASQRLI